MKLGRTLLLLAVVCLSLSACAVPEEPRYVSAYPYAAYGSPYYDYGPSDVGVWAGWGHGWDRQGSQGGWHAQNGSPHVSHGASAVSHAWHGSGEHGRG